MCIVVDLCTFASFFKTNSQKHCFFRPVLEWIIKGKGKLVYGGSQYKDELKRSSSYIRIFLQLKKAGKVIEVDDTKVDERHAEIDRIISDHRFNDAHIIGIICVSCCRLICTSDQKAINPYFKRSDLYPQGVNRPKIFSGKKQNRALLCDANIAEICKPAKKGSQELCALFGV